jgi:hypothetical protein
MHGMVDHDHDEENAQPYPKPWLSNHYETHLDRFQTD